jgi:hypothetical protein
MTGDNTKSSDKPAEKPSGDKTAPAATSIANIEDNALQRRAEQLQRIASLRLTGETQQPFTISGQEQVVEDSRPFAMTVASAGAKAFFGELQKQSQEIGQAAVQGMINWSQDMANLPGNVLSTAERAGEGLGRVGKYAYDLDRNPTMAKKEIKGLTKDAAPFVLSAHDQLELINKAVQRGDLPQQASTVLNNFAERWQAMTPAEQTLVGVPQLLNLGVPLGIGKLASLNELAETGGSLQAINSKLETLPMSERQSFVAQVEKVTNKLPYNDDIFVNKSPDRFVRMFPEDAEAAEAVSNTSSISDGASHFFLREVKQLIESLPENEKAFLRSRGIKIEAVGHVAEHVENADQLALGCYRDGSNKIFIGQQVKATQEFPDLSKPLNEKGEPTMTIMERIIPNREPVFVLRHEIGHAYNVMHQEFAGPISDRYAPFIKAYNRDRAAMSDVDFQRLIGVRNFSTINEQRDEVFAELYAHLKLGADSATNGFSRLMFKNFQECYKALEEGYANGWKNPVRQ